MASDFSIRHAAHAIRHGETIAYPTDTIYGLGCNPFDFDAVENLITIKQRSENKQFILLAAHFDQIKPFINISKKQKNLVIETTEATSWVIAANKNTPPWLTDSDNALTFRISKNLIVRKLCQTLGHAIISTSANPEGKPPANNSLEIHRYFHRQIKTILATQQGLTTQPSKIIRLCDNHVIR